LKNGRDNGRSRTENEWKRKGITGDIGEELLLSSRKMRVSPISAKGQPGVENLP